MLDKAASIASVLSVIVATFAIIISGFLLRAERNHRFSERGRTDADRYAKAVATLQDPSRAARLGGIYSLEALANGNPSYRDSCIDVMCAYLRIPHDPAGAGESLITADDERLIREEEAVRSAIVRSISSHLRPHVERDWQGRTFDLTGATLTIADFAGIELRHGTRLVLRNARFPGGRVDFSATALLDGQVDFAGASFSGGRVAFDGSSLHRGKLDFSAATFAGGTVGFAGVKFNGAEVSFRQASFAGGLIDFGAAIIESSDVDFADANFAGSRLTFDSARFAGGSVRFSGASFAGGRIDFSGADLLVAPSFDTAPSDYVTGLPASDG